MSRHLLLGLSVALLFSSQTASTFGQGLIWKVAPEGTEVQYEGDYTQEDERPNSVPPRIKLDWRRRLSMRALHKTTAAYKGNPNAECQWFEFEVVTASEVGGDGDLVPGPGGRRIYKVLVPLESAPIGPPMGGKVVDSQGIPVSYLPIVKGFRRIDSQAATPIKSGVFHTSPMLTLMAHYRNLDLVAEEADPQVSLQEVGTAKHYHGELIMESPTDRTTNKADIYASDVVPFGLARWKVEITRETKDGKADRGQYKLASTYRVDMKVVRIQNTGATSKLAEE